jgi:hypothetical protein
VLPLTVACVLRTRTPSQDRLTVARPGSPPPSLHD